MRVTQGVVFDVAVDIRRSSPSFGQWVGLELSASNHRMLWIPAGFAHGFYVLSDSADFQYKCTDFYNPAAESIRWDDPTLNIQWLLVKGQAPHGPLKMCKVRYLHKRRYFTMLITGATGQLGSE